MSDTLCAMSPVTAGRNGSPGVGCRRAARPATALAALTAALLAGAAPAFAQVGNPGVPLSASPSNPGDPVVLPQGDSETELDRIGIALGAGYSIGPTYAGSRHMGYGFSPAARITWRGYTLSSSSVAQARAVSNEQASRETGLSGPLVRRSRVGFGLGLALRRGRTVSDEQRAEGLKNLKTTVIGRARARYFFSEDLVLTGTFTTDLLGRRGGIAVPVGLSWKKSLTRTLLLTSDIGFTWANASTIAQDFGIGPEESAASGMPTYRPSAGIREVAGSFTIVHEPFEHWVWLLRGSIVQLTGPAASSPVTKRRFQPGVLLGLVYRFDV